MLPENLIRIEELSAKINRLLANAEPGLFTWNSLLGMALREMGEEIRRLGIEPPA